MELLGFGDVLKQEQQKNDLGCGAIVCNFNVIDPLNFFILFSVGSDSTYQSEYSPLKLHKDSSDLDRQTFITHFMKPTIDQWVSDEDDEADRITIERFLSNPELVSVDLSYGGCKYTFTPAEVLNCVDTANDGYYSPSWRSVHGAVN